MRRSNNQNRKLSLKSDRLSMLWKQTLNWNLINAVNQMLYWLDCKETFHHYIIKMFNKININYQVKVCLPDFGILKKTKNKTNNYVIKLDVNLPGEVGCCTGQGWCSPTCEDRCASSRTSHSPPQTRPSLTSVQIAGQTGSLETGSDRILAPGILGLQGVTYHIGNHKYKTVMLNT